MKLKITPDKLIMLFVRIKGSKGTREVRAVIDTGSVYSIISVQDARRLGYEAWGDPEADADPSTTAITKSDIFSTDEIVLEEVSVDGLVAKNVTALTYELPTLGRVEAILGLNYLKNFKTTIDFEKGYLTIEPT